MVKFSFCFGDLEIQLLLFKPILLDKGTLA